MEKSASDQAVLRGICRMSGFATEFEIGSDGQTGLTESDTFFADFHLRKDCKKTEIFHHLYYKFLNHTDLNRVWKTKYNIHYHRFGYLDKSVPAKQDYSSFLYEVTFFLLPFEFLQS